MAQDQEGPLYFWREFEPDFGFMSQWFTSPFTVSGITYQTAEMWMMIEKARLFGDHDIAKQMTETTVPSEHQHLGRLAKGFDRGKWDEHKGRIVEEGNFHKFSQDEELKRKLLETGERELVEASPRDRIWGIGFGKEDAGSNREDWGENRLGVALMNVRGRLRKEGGM
ncbi:hypothetical protein AC579_964 [Pseudocercospora musae]|uniref:NADAR domain-containing protein n=1 Tax=Pseudocercospora musae TaxID=113226 RepID=A0A139IUF6_9PEZI|nr:hypothetical protein AC579_964 [Pseudocercospora musae]KXT18364.1 hypothetical protein AC579_964 [Pseudocercospora musae]KXT18365.1 hypothetical protein AC579_964 [Pseudocercospora musae]